MHQQSPMHAVEPENATLATIGAAAGAGAVATLAAMQLKKKRESAAVIELYNAVVELPEPHMLTQETVANVGKKFAMDMRKHELDGLQRIYGTYLESVIPLGDTQLKCAARHAWRRIELLQGHHSFILDLFPNPSRAHIWSLSGPPPSTPDPEWT